MFISFFKDKNGKFVIWQKPNLVLIFWAIFTITAILMPAGQAKDLLILLAFGAICIWAFLEVIFGASYFRRVLGLVVLVFSLLNKLK